MDRRVFFLLVSTTSYSVSVMLSCSWFSPHYLTNTVFSWLLLVRPTVLLVAGWSTMSTVWRKLFILSKLFPNVCLDFIGTLCESFIQLVVQFNLEPTWNQQRETVSYSWTHAVTHNIRTPSPLPAVLEEQFLVLPWREWQGQRLRCLVSKLNIFYIHITVYCMWTAWLNYDHVQKQTETFLCIPDSMCVCACLWSGCGFLTVFGLLAGCLHMHFNVECIWLAFNAICHTNKIALA